MFWAHDTTRALFVSEVEARRDAAHGTDLQVEHDELGIDLDDRGPDLAAGADAMHLDRRTGERRVDSGRGPRRRRWRPERAARPGG